MMFEVVVERPFPRAIVGHAPALGVVGGAGVREERDRLVRPHATRDQMLAPPLDVVGVVDLRVDQVRLDERHALAREEQPLGDLVGRKAAVLVEEIPPVLADALHAGLDRDAAGGAEQHQHVAVPQIDARLNADLDAARRERFQQLAVGQKDLVDEVHVLDALRDERVELVENRRERPLAVGVAEAVVDR